MEIKTTQTKTGAYYKMQIRGIQYTLRRSIIYADKWELTSQRKALGTMNPGTTRYFNSLIDIGKTIKSLKGLDQMID